MVSQSLCVRQAGLVCREAIAQGSLLVQPAHVRALLDHSGGVVDRTRLRYLALAAALA